MKKYLITSREFYTDTPAVFRSILQEQLKTHLPDYALYRDKSNPNYEKQAEDFIDVCNQFQNIKCFLHQNIKLAKTLNAYGVHLTSNQLHEIKQAKKLGLQVIISTHNFEEVKKAKDFGADYVTYSPIFHSPNKGVPKGIEDLKKLQKEVKNMKIFALGGIINETQIEEILQTDIYGFASIRYFYN